MPDTTDTTTEPGTTLLTGLDMHLHPEDCHEVGVIQYGASNAIVIQARQDKDTPGGVQLRVDVSRLTTTPGSTAQADAKDTAEFLREVADYIDSTLTDPSLEIVEVVEGDPDPHGDTVPSLLAAFFADIIRAKEADENTPDENTDDEGTDDGSPSR